VRLEGEPGVEVEAKLFYGRGFNEEFILEVY